LRFLMLRVRPHPARLDGEEDGELAGQTRQIHDPIRLARMVKEIIGYGASGGISFTIQASWMGSLHAFLQHFF
jgi:hypothetical protein